MREGRVAALETLAAPLRSRGLSVTTTSHWLPRVDEGIVEHAIRSNIDLVVKDAAVPARMKAAAEAQAHWGLIRQIPMPLLLVRPEEWQGQLRIAVSVDPCHLGDRPVALDEAIVAMGSCLGRALAAQVRILHVLESPPHLFGETITSQAREEAHALLAPR